MIDYPLADSESELNVGKVRYSLRKFPHYRYIPGIHPHPINSPEGHSFGLEEPELESWDSSDWKENEDYFFGVDLYNYHYYWEAHEAWEGLWTSAVRNSSEHRFLQGLIKCGAALLKVRMAKYAIQDLIGARTLSKSGIDLLNRAGVEQFMGLNVPLFIEAYEEFINPIYEDNIPEIDSNTPRIELIF